MSANDKISSSPHDLFGPLAMHVYGIMKKQKKSRRFPPFGKKKREKGEGANE